MEGSTGWLKLERTFDTVPNCLLHYSHPSDLHNLYPHEGVRLDDDKSPSSDEKFEFAIYGFAPGSHRRRIRITAGDHVLQEYLVLLKVVAAKVSKSFDLFLSGARATKKIEIHNPYPTRKTFLLHSKRDCTGLRILQSSITLEPMSQRKVDIEFSGATGKFLIFINGQFFL